MPEAAAADAPWRAIGELAVLIGAYCWVENRVFEVCGDWAAGAGDTDESLEPALRVWCAAVSRRHGVLATRWAERLPVRAGVDRDALVVAPAGPLPGALAAVADTSDVRTGVSTVVETVFPRLRAVYGMHQRTASPVSEGPVLEVLAVASRDLTAEITAGRALLEEGPRGLATDAALGPELERAFADTRVFPAVPPS